MRRAVGLLILCISGAVAAQPAPDPVTAGSGAEPGSASGSAAGSAAADAPLPPLTPTPQPQPKQSVTPEAPPAAAAAVHPDTLEDWAFRPGGFLQGEYRSIQDGYPGYNTNDGFRLVRARFTGTGTGHVGSLALGSYFEAELQPQFQLFDAYVTASHALPHGATLSLDVGQMRVPISRQQLISDTRLSFVEKAQIATVEFGSTGAALTPDRDLGGRLTFAIPHVRVYGGIFNGEGRAAGGVNTNESFLYAGRVEVTPIGEQAPYAESAFSGQFLSFAGSVGHNKLTPDEIQNTLGYDVSGAMRGVSGSFEYIQVKHAFGASTMQSNYRANGFVAQLAYLLPIETWPKVARIEVGARVEEVDRNDTTPIIAVGDPNQSVRVYTGVISYYLKQHRAKVQISYSRFQSIEDRTASDHGPNPDAAFHNDQLLAQLTYRVE